MPVIKRVKDKDHKELKEHKDTKERKDKDFKERKDTKEHKEGKDKDVKERKDTKEHKEGKDKDFKEYKDHDAVGFRVDEMLDDSPEMELLADEGMHFITEEERPIVGESAMDGDDTE